MCMALPGSRPSRQNLELLSKEAVLSSTMCKFLAEAQGAGFHQPFAAAALGRPAAERRGNMSS